MVRELSETSLIFLVHPTLPEEQMEVAGEVVGSLMAQAVAS